MSFAPPDPASQAAQPAGSTQTAAYQVRDGDLTTPWRLILGAAWALALTAYAGVWQASVQIGIGTWWLGPRAQPTDFYIRVIPFLIPLVVILALAYDARYPVRISLAGSIVAAVISVPDFERTVALGALELLIAGLLLAVTLVAMTGRYRIPR